MSAHDKNTHSTDTSFFYVSTPYDIAYRNAAAVTPVGPHSHNAVEFYFTLTDLPDVLLNDTVLAVPAGALLILPAFCVHQLYHEAGVTYERYILTVQDQWLSNTLCEGSAKYAYLHDSDHPLILFPKGTKKEELLRHFDELLSQKDRSSTKALVGLLQLLDDIHTMKTAKKDLQKMESLPISSSQQKVNEILAYLGEHLRENLTISELADHFYLHPDYLARLFKKHMHISLGHYITLQKISAAETLLREGKTVTEVQEYLGYSSYAYFFRTFQKITGISPSRYRNLR